MLDNKKFNQDQLKQIKGLLIQKIDALQKIKTILIKNQFEKDKNFYKLVSSYLKKGYDYTKIGKIIFEKNKCSVSTRYLRYCHQYGWKNWNTNKNKKRFVVSKDKEFYDLINSYLENGKTFADISQILGLSESAASGNYYHICKRNGWDVKHRNTKLTPKKKPPNLDLNKNQNLKFYKLVSSILRQNKTYKEAAEILGISSNQLMSKYLWCCKRYNLENQKTHFWKPTFNKTKDFNLYEIINKYLLQGKNFEEISKILKKKQGYTGSIYSRICKRWKLPLKTIIHKWNKTQDEEYYCLINNYLKKGLTYKQIDKVMNKKLGYTASEYPRIIQHYGWLNMNPRSDEKVNWTKQEKIDFYNLVSEQLKTISFTKIAINIGMNYYNLKSWYYRICKEFKLENKNPRKKHK